MFYMCSVGEIMNIQLLTPKFLSYKKNNENFHSSTAMRSNLAGLNADTVTFFRENKYFARGFS